MEFEVFHGIVRVKDVARVELGQQDYSTISQLNGKPSAIIAIYQLPGSNALQTAEGVRKLMARMKERFPEDVDYAISLDQTLPVTEGLRDVVETQFSALQDDPQHNVPQTSANTECPEATFR